MTTEQYKDQLYKIMKPYWDSKFSHTKLEECVESLGIWFGLSINGKTIVGCPIDELEDGIWFYTSSEFAGGHDLFGISKIKFRISMLKYLNETYNLNIRLII